MEENLSLLEPSLEKQLKGHKNSITALCFSPNDYKLATSSLDNSVMLWDLRGTIRSYRFQGHDEAVMDITFSPSGKYMASASRDKTVRVWVPTVTGSTGMFKAHSQTVRSVQFSSDGTKIVTGSDDKIVKLWTSDKHKFLSSFVGHTNWVRCARISNDCSVIASCSDDKTTRLWSLDDGKCINVYKDQKGYGVNVAWHPSGCYVAVGTSVGNVKLYDIRTHNLVQHYSIHAEAINQVAFHPSGSYIISASKDGKMKILDLLEGHPVFTLSGHSGSINSVNFSSTGDTFASAGDDRMVFVWKTNFTELALDNKENFDNDSALKSASSQNSKVAMNKGKTKGTKKWYMCYHSMKFPVTSFVHVDGEVESICGSTRCQSVRRTPNANSTLSDASQGVPDSVTNANIDSSRNSTENNVGSTHPGDWSTDTVGHMSHIPRAPPTPATFSVPSVINKPMDTIIDQEDLFGMIKLKENDVCYTSGTIEWVGRKRSFPINSGFKILEDHKIVDAEGSSSKRAKNANKTNTFVDIKKLKECDCADILPTVNAIIDHLNALHEAVDIVDLRLNTLEGAII